MWITSGPGQKSCTQHDVTFAATRSCPQCAGPARLNQLDDNGDRVDPFPELTAALGPQIAENRLMAERYRAIGDTFCNGDADRGLVPSPTAAAAMYRLEAQRVDRAHLRIELLAEHRRVAALAERKSWSRSDPAERPGIVPDKPAPAPSDEGEVH